MVFHDIKKTTKNNNNNKQKISLWSKRIWRLLRLIAVPVHLRPSPVYPGLHVQTCDPRVLLQVAFTWHLPWYVLHSSISVKKNKKRKERKMRKRFYSWVKREKRGKNVFCNFLVSCGSRVGPVSQTRYFFKICSRSYSKYKGYAINCSYFAIIAQKSRNKQRKKEWTKRNHPWPHFLAVPNAVVLIWIWVILSSF